MRNEEMVLWSYALSRAWNGARSWRSKEWFAACGMAVAYHWNMARFRKIEGLMKKAKVAP